MATAEDTLCGWGNDSKVAYFFENAEIIVPRRAEQLKLLVDLIPYSFDANLSVLDLGAGFGSVTEEILRHFLAATAICVDGSEAMIARASARLSKYGARARIVKADLSDRSWLRSLRHGVGASGMETKDDYQFNVVVSAIAIHHLTDRRKQELYREVFQLLTPGGIFLNDDVVSTPSGLKKQFEKLNLAAIQEQERAQRGVARSPEEIEKEMRERLRLAGGEHQSRIASLVDQLRWLVEAGFASVDCYWRYLDLAIFGGIRER
jgi:tRNA (cmo5U34)-methyltransferase